MKKIKWFLISFFGKKYFIKVVDEGIKKDEIIIHGRKFYIHEESVLFNQDRKEVN